MPTIPSHLPPGWSWEPMAPGLEPVLTYYPPAAPPGTRGRKLTAEQVLDIRRSRLPAGVLAGVYRVTPFHIWRIQQRLQWAQLRGEGE
jgi:hypothetical protein